MPAAAQLACTPLVAAISGQVSLVAVVANLLVAPVVGPATVLGLAGGLLTLVWAPARPAVRHARVVVRGLAGRRGRARRGLPTAAVGWGTGAVALVAADGADRGRRRGRAVAAAPPGDRRRGRPAAGGRRAGAAARVRLAADGWVLVACDVGQGDALVLNAGPGRRSSSTPVRSPRRWTGCLDRLGVGTVPLLVLTHFHADHVDGISGVFAGRRVGAVETTPAARPAGRGGRGRRRGVWCRAAAAPATYAAASSVGPVTLQVLWPRRDSPTVGPGDGSTANEASVVLLVEVAGLRLLLTGDVEPEGQAELARLLPGLHVDVLKMPHHGSAHQDEPWLLSLDPAWCWCRSAPTTTTATPLSRRWQPLERGRRRGLPHRPGRRPGGRRGDGGDVRVRHQRVTVDDGCRSAVLGWPAWPARRDTAGPGHAGHRQGGVPRRAHRRGDPRGGAAGRPRGRALRDPGLRADPGDLRRAGRALAVQLGALRRGAGPRGAPRGVRRRSARLRRRARRGRRAGAGALGRRPKGSGVLDQAAQARQP